MWASWGYASRRCRRCMMSWDADREKNYFRWEFCRALVGTAAQGQGAGVKVLPETHRSGMLSPDIACFCRRGYKIVECFRRAFVKVELIPERLIIFPAPHARPCSTRLAAERCIEATLILW